MLPPLRDPAAEALAAPALVVQPNTSRTWPFNQGLRARELGFVVDVVSSPIGPATLPSDSAPPPARLLVLTARIVSAHVERNPVAPEQLPELIRGVHRALGGLDQDSVASPAGPARCEPAVPIRRSVAHDRITCLECGVRMAMLKRHLASAHDLTPEAYRERWGLGRDYPMVAPDYAEVRSGMAKRAGLGRGRRGGQGEGEREAEPAASPDTADAEPAALMDVEPSAPAPKTRRGRKRGSPTSPEEPSQPEPEARADVPQDAVPAEDVTPGTPAPSASGGRRRRRETKGAGLG